eukprot:CAMPEP_0185281242 /NCGR_PEP_ID=MMETSP1359-20130426/66612_1 /TAXON_ID=552665 /ORGANISM="Bigelowiella longifila, Strain CCMP242" /LENGTH=74 /DNA_ID=CAMNT_0027876657 /DNA_START=792 /DNA_END=1016 /DNA_ORIENTATION=-
MTPPVATVATAAKYREEFHLKLFVMRTPTSPANMEIDTIDIPKNTSFGRCAGANFVMSVAAYAALDNIKAKNSN